MLARALSTISSTAAFDKNPQSQERGITLDLGFSSFSMPIPSHIPSTGHKDIQFTLVDCPGHASLIKTIIGGMLVFNSSKSMCVGFYHRSSDHRHDVVGCGCY